MVAAVLAAFALITSGTSVSFAAGHLGLPVVRAGNARAASQEVALCIRASDPAVVAKLPTILASLQTSSGSVAVLNYQDRWFASKVGIGPNAVPSSLRKAVLAGSVGRQLFPPSSLR